MWFKHDRDFLKRLWPTKPPMIRQHLVWLAMLAWEEQGIVKDFNYLAWLSGIPAETLETIWPDYEAASDQRENRWMPAEMWQAFDSYEAKVEQASSAGKTSAERRLNARTSKGSTSAQRSLNGRSTDKDKDKNKNIHSGTNVPDADVPPPDISHTPTTSQELKTILAYRFAECLAAEDVDAPRYKASKADFIQTEALWKRNQTAGKEGGPWEFFPDRIARALANYRASPIGRRTLADFCARFSTFYTHPLDQYGKPATQGAQINGTNTYQPSTPAQQQRAAQIGNFGREAKRIGGQPSGSES